MNSHKRWEEVLKMIDEMWRGNGVSEQVISKVDELMRSGEMNEVSEGLEAIKQLLATYRKLKKKGKEKEAELVLQRASLLALMVYELLKIKDEGGRIVTRDDLVKVGEIDGWIVYKLRNFKEEEEKKGGVKPEPSEPA